MLGFKIKKSQLFVKIVVLNVKICPNFGFGGKKVNLLSKVWFLM